MYLGAHSRMAGHDINYLGLSGVLDVSLQNYVGTIQPC